MSRGELPAVILCPSCSGPTHVYDSRGVDRNKAVRRRRECLSCKTRFRTIEKIEIISKPAWDKPPTTIPTEKKRGF